MHLIEKNPVVFASNIKNYKVDLKKRKFSQKLIMFFILQLLMEQKIFMIDH